MCFCWCCHVSSSLQVYFLIGLPEVKDLVIVASTNLKKKFPLTLFFFHAKPSHWNSWKMINIFVVNVLTHLGEWSVGTLGPARVYRWERFYRFLWAPAQDPGPSYMLREITQAPPPVINISCVLHTCKDFKLHFCYVTRKICGILLDVCLLKPPDERVPFETST